MAQLDKQQSVAVILALLAFFCWGVKFGAWLHGKDK